ncbi:MAG: haloalkane dehalogenase [Dehalococcoidia bacterium]|nr:haloalkane dehalogenase [Dehalococcoidia bacterium]
MAEQEISAAFPYESRFVSVHGARMHYVEQGEGAPVLFLHGNPTSSYLWRNVIPHVSPLARCIAPDLIGMGKSDQPDIEYRFFDHYRYVDGFIEALGLRDLALVVHDWGSALGFHYAAQHAANVRGIAFMEAIVRPLTWDEWPEQARQLFQAFRTPGVGEQMILEQNMFVEQVLPGAVLRKLTDAEMARYREPYPDPRSRKPTWRWPNEIPVDGQPPDVVQAVQQYSDWLKRSPLPKLLLWAQPGAIMRNLVGWCQENFPNLTSVDIGPGVHFIQEDRPHEIGGATAKWYREEVGG